METNVINSGNLYPLVIKLTDNSKDHNSETATAKIQWDGGFSASMFRKVVQEKTVSWIKRIDAKHSVNRGTKLTVQVTFLGQDFKSQPIYFGGEVDTDKFKAERQLKEQLKFFIDDVKVQVESK